jgi:hypothetical protein
MGRNLGAFGCAVLAQADLLSQGDKLRGIIAAVPDHGFCCVNRRDAQPGHCGVAVVSHDRMVRPKG